MKPDALSSEWSTHNVLEQMRASTAKGERVAAHVFLQDDTPSDSLRELAAKLIAEAKKKVGKKADAELGKVHGLAKSFSITADLDTLAAVANTPQVKTILPAQIPDILPKPRNVGSV